MKRWITMFLGAALAAMSAVAAAQQTHTFRHEASLFGSWDDVDEPEQSETLNLNLRYGYFVSPRALATASLSRLSIEDSSGDAASTTFLLGAKYYFGELRMQSLVPFVDGGIGFTHIDTGADDGTDLSWEFGGGVAMFFTPNTSIDAALRFYNTDTDARNKGIRLFLGLTTRF
jgi:opacity protein-like surface antigen